jgi:hypothetical protein
MDSPSPPAAPDPYVTANAQATANRDAAATTAALNRPDQYTPYGSMTWSQGAPTRTFNQQRYDQAVAAAQQQAARMGTNPRPGRISDLNDLDSGAGSQGPTPFAMPDRNADQFYDMTPSTRWTSRVNLDPRVQAILDAQLQTSQGLQGATQSALSRVQDTFSRAAPTPNDEMRQRMEGALYGRYTSRMDPQFQQQEESLRSALMNRGIVEGSEAWRNQMDNFSRGKNDAYSTALQDATFRGGQEMSNLYGMEMAGRNAVLNELNALRSGQQVNTPQFQPGASGASVNPAPIAQSIANNYQGQMNAYNAQVGSNNSMMGGLFSLGSAVLGIPGLF